VIGGSEGMSETPQDAKQADTDVVPSGQRLQARENDGPHAADIANDVLVVADARSALDALDYLAREIMARSGASGVALLDAKRREVAASGVNESPPNDVPPVLEVTLRCGWDTTGYLRFSGIDLDTIHYSSQQRVAALQDLAALTMPRLERELAEPGSHDEWRAPAHTRATPAPLKTELPILRFLSEFVCDHIGADFAYITATPVDATDLCYGGYAMRSDRWQFLRDQSAAGLAARCQTLGQPIVMDFSPQDRAASHEELALRFMEGARVLLAVPLLAGPRAHGVLMIGWRNAAAIERQHIDEAAMHAARLSMMLAHQGGATVLRQLSTIPLVAGARGSLDVTIPAIVRASSEIMEIKQCAMLIVDDRGKRLTPMAAVGLPVAFFRGFGDLGVGRNTTTSGRAILLKETIITDDLMLDADWKPYASLASPLGIRAVWASPVIVKSGRVIGCFTVYRSEPGAPQPMARALLDLFASVLAWAYDNARADPTMAPPLSAVEFAGSQLAVMVEQMPGAVVAYDASGAVQYRNAAADAMGFAQAQDRGTAATTGTMQFFIQDGSALRGLDARQWPGSRALAGEIINNVEMLCRAPDLNAPSRWVRVSAAPLRDAAGTITGAICVFHDAGNEQQLLHKLTVSEARVRALQDSMPNGLALFDADGSQIWANAASAEITGLTGTHSHATLDALPWIADEGGTPCLPSAFPAHRARRTGAAVRGEVMALAGDNGARRWVQVDATPVLDAAGKTANVVVSLLDVSRHKHVEGELSRLALYDTLTGLPNRTRFQQLLEEAFIECVDDSICLLLLDLDRFREVNDTLGHVNGDILVGQFAARLVSMLSVEAVVGRLGGDEFGVLLKHADIARAASTARGILKTLEPPFEIVGQTFDVEVSIGIAVSPDHGRDSGALLRHADIAMYFAKHARDGFAVYNPKHDIYSPDRLSLLGDLRRSIEQGHLFLVYQPQVRISDGQVTGVEALVRWQHPTRGMIAPDQFIQLAEGSGAIKPLTLWVLNEALRQCAEWRGGGIDLGVAVNLSARNLHDDSLASTIGDLLLLHRVPPKRLALEITESAIMSDPGGAMVVLTRLSNMGTRLSIDDFGTGYSSLAYLQRLPAHEIKIDKSFVLKLSDSANDQAIVKSITDLGHNLGHDILAEGVENQAALDILSVLGCDAAQGYYLSRPKPARDITPWLEERARRTSPPPGGGPSSE
jgi:diguanylate cyclase (GGDEF)-like protein